MCVYHAGRLDHCCLQTIFIPTVNGSKAEQCHQNVKLRLGRAIKIKVRILDCLNYIVSNIHLYISEIQMPDEESGESSTASKKQDKMVAQQHNREDMIKKGRLD